MIGTIIALPGSTPIALNRGGVEMTRCHGVFYNNGDQLEHDPQRQSLPILSGGESGPSAVAFAASHPDPRTGIGMLQT